MARRLAAVLAADVVGYSRLVGVDEAGTLSAIKTHHKDLIEPKARQYDGRIAKLMGDGVLMEFASAVDAVAFAVEVQRAMRQRNAQVPENRRILYRIGINISDIVIEDDDIFGDGVNIAARLETLAEPSGICIARNVFDQVKNKLHIGFRDLGEQRLKNIPDRVRTYRVVADEKEGAATPVDFGVSLSLPDRPSIAVLPFDDMSADPEQLYLGDGLAENIITRCPRFRACS